MSGGGARSASGGRRGCGLSGCRTMATTPEVRAEAGLLTVGIPLDIGRGTSALGTSRNTAIGVVGLVVAGTGNLVAFCSTADIPGVTYIKTWG